MPKSSPPPQPTFYSATHDLARLQQHVAQLQHSAPLPADPVLGAHTNAPPLADPLRPFQEAWTQLHTRLHQLEQQVRDLQNQLHQKNQNNQNNQNNPSTPRPELPQMPQDGWYAALEAALRGSTADIAQRQQHYLEFVRRALDAQVQLPSYRAPLPVLDLGCGRGEWLAQLASAGLRTVGVDSDAAMLAHAQQDRGVQVLQADLLDYLSTQAPASFGAITAFQVVEHLPLPVLLHLLSQSYRVLAPGGVLILETPNPENIQVGAYSFWLDPTHQRPLPPPLLFTLAGHYGFERRHIERCSPWAQHSEAASSPTLPDPHLAKILYCEQDYALIAYKPQ